MSAKTPRPAAGQKRNQSLSPDASPQDQHVPKTNVNKGRKNVGTEPGTTPVDVHFDPDAFLHWIRNPDDAEAASYRHNQKHGSLVEKQMTDQAELEKVKKRFEALKLGCEKTEKQIAKHWYLMRVGRQIHNNRKKYKYAGMSLDDINFHLNVPSTQKLLQWGRQQRSDLLQDLLEGGITYNEEVRAKVEAITDPDELDSLEESGTITKNGQLKKLRGVQRGDPQINYRLVKLLDLPCDDVNLQHLRSRLKINECFVPIKGGGWEFTVPSGESQVVGQSKRHTEAYVKRLLGSGSLPTHVVDKLTSLKILYAMEPSACKHLFTALCRSATGGVLSNVKTVACSNITDHAQIFFHPEGKVLAQAPRDDEGKVLLQTLATCLKEATPSLEALVMEGNATGDAQIRFFKDSIQAATFVNLNNMGLSSVQNLFALLGDNKKGFSFCNNNAGEDFKVWEGVKAFSKLQEVHFGAFKGGGTSVAQVAGAWSCFTKGLCQLPPEQFRCLEFVGYDASKANLDDLTDWLQKADNLEFFVLSHAETSSEQLARFFKPMRNKKHLLVMDVTSSLVEDDNHTFKDGGETGCEDDYDSDEEFTVVKWDAAGNLNSEFTYFAIGFPPNLTHLKLEDLSIVDDYMVGFLAQLSTKTELQQLSLSGNTKLTTASAGAICSAAHWLPALKYVDLSNTGIAAEDYAQTRSSSANAFATGSPLQLRLEDTEEDLLASWDDMWERRNEMFLHLSSFVNGVSLLSILLALVRLQFWVPSCRQATGACTRIEQLRAQIHSMLFVELFERLWNLVLTGFVARLCQDTKTELHRKTVRVDLLYLYLSSPTPPPNLITLGHNLADTVVAMSGSRIDLSDPPAHQSPPRRFLRRHLATGLLSSYHFPSFGSESDRDEYSGWHLSIDRQQIRHLITPYHLEPLVARRG